MGRYLFDIESNGLLDTVTRMWILRVLDMDTGIQHRFLEGDLGWIPMFDDAKIVVGHNIIAYDLCVLEKLFDYRLPKKTKIHDTLLMSQILDYRRFGDRGHGLEVWGEALGYPKIHFDDFSKYSPEMDVYCERDVDLNFKVYEFLCDELRYIADKNGLIKVYLNAEHAAARWAAMANLKGWPFDQEAAVELFSVLTEKLDDAHTQLSAKLGLKCVAYDKAKGEYATKKPKWTSKGCYDHHTAKWFGVDPWSGFEGEERMIVGEHSRVEFEPLSLDSVADVKVFLYRNGWVPTQWNFKIDPDTGEKVRGAPKITEDSLEFLGGDGKLYLDFLTARSRYGILKTWLENVDANGNLHGDCMVVGTPSMRTRHSIIVNVPSADSAYGPEMRRLFRSKPGWKLIGCDSSGNQARGLAHYLGNTEFTDTLLNGDIHQYNADILTEIIRTEFGKQRPEFGIIEPELIEFYKTFTVKRSQAKRILYAFLFGASGSKLWSYIFDVMAEEMGKILKNRFITAVPGFKNLTDKLNATFTATKKLNKGDQGYITSLAGNRIYVDSRHKLLVYLLQSAEKITCSSAAMLTAEWLEKEGIPYQPCIYYHDEIDFMVPEEYAERAAELGKLAFKEGPKMFGVNIMDGDAKIGNDWYEVH